ncbi:triosephosphate isomerase, chloroplastic-like isoform X5 [Zingiber officinale]|uniref:triosephosphate isomerase, chloroplastic-like isoform X5 n=1 Tax=Zingiber officinale TaxID=94328 RepID=UPI001C4ADFD3|nr:triosephosphate isomerase, chloroplastic-like isoform X5 [Zingiber officinale]
MAAAASSSLASQFLGLRREAAPSTALFVQSAQSKLRLPSTRCPNGRVVAMAGTGKFFVGGNWKCRQEWLTSKTDNLNYLKNGTTDSVSRLVADLNDAKLENDVDVVVAPPYIYLDKVRQSLTNRIEISAQNSWVGKGGAFTGEISAEQLIDIGCKWVILGHSERRHIIGEDNQVALQGEKLEERETGKTFDVCFQQMKAFAEWSLAMFTPLTTATRR